MHPAEPTSMLGVYLAFIATGALFALVGLGLWAAISKRHTGAGAHLPYESGERAAGPAYTAVQPRYVVLALIFLLFEIEIAFMFPWSQGAFSQGAGPFARYALVAGVAFVLLLALGLFYVWRAGYLDWPTTHEQPKTWASSIPKDAYKHLVKHADLKAK